jgi:hypothetical protein
VINEAENYRLKAEAWAIADGEARRLEEMRKIVLSEIKSRSDKKTEAAKETAALASAEYRRCVMEGVEARTQANILKGEVKALELSLEIWRTRESTKRAEITLR